MKTSTITARLVAAIGLVTLLVTLFAGCGSPAKQYYNAKAQADALDSEMVSLLDKTLDPVFEEIEETDHFFEAFFVDGMPVLQVTVLTEGASEGYLIRGIPEMGPAVTVFRTGTGPYIEDVKAFLEAATAEVVDGEIVLS